jgi:hypothetical protein
MHIQVATAVLSVTAKAKAKEKKKAEAAAAASSEAMDTTVRASLFLSPLSIILRERVYE